MARTYSTCQKSFGSLGKTHPKMLQAYLALNDAAAAEALDIKTRELISIAVAITTRCESCISVHAEAAMKAGATESEVAGALATAPFECRSCIYICFTSFRGM